MHTKLFVGNLPFDITEPELKDAFAIHGGVSSVDVIMDRLTGKPRGFAFVTMKDMDSAKAAISALDGAKVEGRALTVNEARARETRTEMAGSSSRGGGSRRSY